MVSGERLYTVYLVMIQERVSLAGKTTMRIGGTARFFAEVRTREDAEQAWAFSQEENIPLIALGSGSNTIFADGVINAVVVRIGADEVETNAKCKMPARPTVGSDGQNAKCLTVQAGKNLPMLINDCAAQGLDLSPLTGIPGTVGGAIVGNAGQGPTGIWIDSFVRSVTVFQSGAWKEMPREACGFGYRHSVFKEAAYAGAIVWETLLCVPRGEPAQIQETIEQLLRKRIGTQPHRKTAGSVFKAHGKTPAWQLIDAAGLRGLHIGGVRITEKHANFLENTGEGTFDDAMAIIDRVRGTVQEPLDIEMRFYGEEGRISE